LKKKEKLHWGGRERSGEGKGTVEWEVLPVLDKKTRRVQRVSELGGGRTSSFV